MESVFINGSNIFFVGCEVRGVLGQLHLIPVVFAIAICHAMFRVGAVSEISFVVLYLNV